jgi:ribonuclease R
MALRFQRPILQHVRHRNYEPGDVYQLADDLSVPKEDIEEFRDAVKTLVAEGQLLVGDDGRVRLPELGGELVGFFKKNPKGFGFIIPRSANEHGDLFVPPGETGDAITGDLVRAKVIRQKGRNQPGQSPFVGSIVEVLERKQSAFTGELVKRGGAFYVQPDGKILTDLIMVKDVGAKNAVEGDKVVFELLHAPEGTMLGEGVITEVLGKSGAPDVETAAVIAAYNLEEEFPEDCLRQAREAAAQYDEEIDYALKQGHGFDKFGGGGREDLTKEFILTIDPPTARDFDDALSISRTKSGGWRLGVHIADVAHFIAEGSPLDLEAKDRGNSTYLPRVVLPMLPELLSNGICSLQERVPRYTKSAFMEYDKEGNVQRSGFSQACINSAKRLTYLEAQALIDGDKEEAKKHAKTEPNYTEQLIEALHMLNDLAKTIQRRRMKQGMIRLELPQVELIFEDVPGRAAKVIDAEPEDDAFTHTLIEMCMVEANEASARLFERLGVPLLRRIHPEPAPGAMDDLRQSISVAGVRIPKSPSREELQQILENTRGTPSARAIHFAILRTLTKAEYSPALIGHFALASEAYSHFTSPIRRYPDLTVHRAISAYLARTKNGVEIPRSEQEQKKLGKQLLEVLPSEQELIEVGRHCSNTEVNSSGAENELRNFLVLQLLSEHLGEPYEGVVTGVSPAGVFCQLNKYLVEGLVKASDLPVKLADGRIVSGRWRIDPKSGGLVEQSTGRSYSMGDRITVAVAAVDLARRQMELIVADADARDAGKDKKIHLKLGAEGGGTAKAEGAGFKGMTGAQKRSKRSKSRDQKKGDFRSDRKDKGKRQ